MGVKLKDLASPRKTSFENLSGNSIAIDGYNIIYQFLTTIRGPTGEPLMNSKGKITSHITGLFYRNINLQNNNIRPIYVLDGKPPQLKSTLIKKRKEINIINNTVFQDLVKTGAELPAGQCRECSRIDQNEARLMVGAHQVFPFVMIYPSLSTD